MVVSVLDMFTIGLGPSRSHTVGPMKAAAHFASLVQQKSLLPAVCALKVDTFGSLAAVGLHYGTFNAILLGLEGHAVCDTDAISAQQHLTTIEHTGHIKLCGEKTIPFTAQSISKYPYTFKKHHSNALTFTVLDKNNVAIFSEEYYSVGGGHIEIGAGAGNFSTESAPDNVPYPFSSMAQLRELVDTTGLSVPEIMRANELSRTEAAHLDNAILLRWSIMSSCIERGFRTTGKITLGIAETETIEHMRKAPLLYKRIINALRSGSKPDALDWLNLAAIAVQEENAAGSRIVTAQTNDTPGIFPAVLYYALRNRKFDSLEEKEQSVIDFFLTATAIGHIIVCNAHQSGVSATEMTDHKGIDALGAMTAGAYAQWCNYSPSQITSSIEIAIESTIRPSHFSYEHGLHTHHIEKNAARAVQVMNAVRLAGYTTEGNTANIDQTIQNLLRLEND